MSDETKTIIFKIQIDTEESRKEVVALTDAQGKQTDATKKMTAAIEVEEKSIAALRKQNQELTKQRNAVSTNTEEGRKKILALNAELDKNNTIIKANVDQYTKQKIGIGDYTSGIINALPGLKGMTGGVTGLNLAFKANPIGAIIGLLLSLKAAFEANAIFADKLSFIMGALGKGFQFVIDTIVDTVTNFDKLTEAIKHPIDFLTSFGKGLKDAAVAGYEAAEAIDAFVVEQAKAAQAIELADIKIQSLEKSLKDRTKSERERIAIANELADLEIANSKRRESIASKELENERLRLKGKTLSSEEEASLIEKETEMLKARAEAEVVENQRATRINILLAKEQSQAEEDYSTTKRERNALDADFAVENQTKIQNSLQQTAKITIDSQELMDKANKKYNENNIKYSKKANEIRQTNELTTAQVTSRALGESAALFKKNTIAYKVLATAQALINTYLSATMAFATAPNYIAGVIFAALAVVSGLANVAKINGVAFAKGGKVLSGQRIMSNHGTRINRSNGDNLIATVRTGEVILNEQQQARLGGHQTFAKIGVPGFAVGGIVGANETRIASQQFSNQLTQDELVRIVAAQPPVMILEEFEAKKNSVDATKRIAKVI